MIIPYQRTAVMGFTQSGKTVFVKWLVSQTNACLVLDLKRQYGALGTVVRTPLEAVNAFRKGYRKVILQPEQTGLAMFEEVCRVVWLHLRNIVFVVEEVQAYATKTKIPPSFQKILTIMEGDPYRVGVVSISQRPANMHNDILTQSSLWVIFQLAKNDAEYISRMSGIDTQDINDLSPKHFFVFRNRSVSHGEERVIKYDPLQVDPRLLH